MIETYSSPIFRPRIRFFQIVFFLIFEFFVNRFNSITKTLKKEMNLIFPKKKIWKRPLIPLMSISTLWTACNVPNLFFSFLLLMVSILEIINLSKIFTLINWSCLLFIVFSQRDTQVYQQLIHSLNQKERTLYDEIVGPGALRRREELQQQKQRESKKQNTNK